MGSRKWLEGKAMKLNNATPLEGIHRHSLRVSKHSCTETFFFLEGMGWGVTRNVDNVFKFPWLLPDSELISGHEQSQKFSTVHISQENAVSQHSFYLVLFLFCFSWTGNASPKGSF